MHTRKDFCAFPAFHLIIQLFKIATHNHIAKLITHLFSLCHKDCGRHSPLLQPACHGTSPLGGYQFTRDLGKKEKGVVALLQQIHLSFPSKNVFPSMLHPGVVGKIPLCLITTFFGYLPVCSSHDFCYAASHSFHEGSRNSSAHKHTYVHLLLS